MADRPRITEDELAQRLVNSRKVMKKVDTGEYQKGNVDLQIDENLLRNDSSDSDNLMMESNMSVPTPSKLAGLPVGVPSIEKIRSSKLPDAIKQAMIENPIEQISLNDGLSMDLVSKTRRLMEEDNGSNKKVPTTRQPIKEQFQSETIPSNLEMVIENVVRRVLDEKLSQILNAQAGTTINENLAIKVGNSIFTGKITKVKNSK